MQRCTEAPATQPLLPHLIMPGHHEVRSSDVHARRLNVRGAFAVRDGRARARLSAAGHVAIVDDVITTGSTMNELRRVLLEAGVRRVEVWAVARVA